MLCERGSEGSKSYFERLRGVSFSKGKSFGRRWIGKRGRSLGIRWRDGVKLLWFLYVSGEVLTDMPF